jgi:phosphoglycerate dehydrogenase-like enzyme
MNVIAWSQNLDPAQAAEHGVKAVSKSELFEQSDIVSIHMVLSDRSRGIVGRADLEKMKPTAWLINTSRGPLVDEDALVDVLTAGKIGGAGLDVFSTEPLPVEHPFRSLPNVLATPHVGYVTEDTYRLFYGQSVENIVACSMASPLSGRFSQVDEPRTAEKAAWSDPDRAGADSCPFQPGPAPRNSKSIAWLRSARRRRFFCRFRILFEYRRLPFISLPNT